MAYIRRLPSGKWQVTVRGLDGHRHTKTFLLKQAAEKWGTRQEADVDAGTWSDPSAGKITVGEWWEKWWAARTGAVTTLTKDESRWRIHVAPQWDRWQIRAVSRLDVQAWVKKMEAAGVGPATVHGAYHLLSALLRAATLETPPLIPVSPCQQITLPPIPRKRARVYSAEQVDRILEQLGARYRLLVELDSFTGLRWGELVAIHGDQVDWDSTPATITVHRVVAREGGRYVLREWPKSESSNRVIPLPDHLRDQLWTLLADGPPGALLFPALGGCGYLSDVNFVKRVWYPALLRVGRCPAHGRPPGGEVARREYHAAMQRCAACSPVPYWPPRVLRHTAGSLLLRAGVPKEQVKELLGHSRESTTDIYAQFEPGALPDVQAAWTRRVDPDAQVTHGHEEARSPEEERASDSPTA